MKLKSKYLFTLMAAVSFCFVSCNDDNIPENPDDSGITENPGDTDGTDEPEVPETFDVTYTESMEDFANPERGFYKYTEVGFRNGKVNNPISVASLSAYRETGKTLIYQYNYLTDFMEGDISEEALNVIRTNMQALRDAGMKVVLRFAYKDGYSEEDKPWDPEVDVVLRHVEQLKPILQEYYDVIYVLQAGFVGSWGEWYYTDHFGFEPSTVEEFKPRRQLLDALLDALPEERQIAVRYPEAKFMCMDIEIADTITAATAFNGSDLSRIAGHNDCFVSSSNDVGTYKKSRDKQLWRAETDYVSMGGETCDAPEYYCNCDATFDNLEEFHWSYLNSDYNTATHAVWKDGGCFEEISRRLGYRIVLEGANYGDFAAGKEFSIDIKLKNVGFASFINPRDLEFVITSSSDPSEKYVIATDFDPRVWKGGKEYRYQTSITLPSELKSGEEYCLYMNLPDAAETLHDNPLFSARLANENVWDETTGYNLLSKFTAE